jgi:hypothetical protein
MTTHQKRRLAGAFLCMLLPTPDHPFHLQPRLRMVSVITSALADGVFSAARNSMQSMACAIRASLPPKDRSSTRTVSNGLCSNDSGDGRCQGSRKLVRVKNLTGADQARLPMRLAKRLPTIPQTPAVPAAPNVPTGDRLEDRA